MHKESRLLHLLFFTNCGRLLIHFLLEGALLRGGGVWDGPPSGGPASYSGSASRKRYTTIGKWVELGGRTWSFVYAARVLVGGGLGCAG